MGKRTCAYLVKVNDSVTTGVRLKGWISSPDDIINRVLGGEGVLITCRNAEACKVALEKDDAAVVDIQQK